MMYKSSRNALDTPVSAAEAILRGLAPDGGLYMPTEIPSLTLEELTRLQGMTYPERAARILSLFLTDYTEEELLEDCRIAYSEERFPGGATPIHEIGDGLFSLELWHGPTCAFKDMALQLMPRLLSRAIKKCGETETALILVATSGDTGKAALAGYRDVPGVKMMVFYPTDGVSKIQKLQMATQEGENLTVRGITGNFDDAQNGVKAIFHDPDMIQSLSKEGYFFSSANSINWGRLAPQIVYYISSYCDMVAGGHIVMGAPLDVCVPTGNFGNILAAYFAKAMGLPLGRLICASNKNDVLTEFIKTGRYNKNRSFHATISPSMDILISSNIERLLALIGGSEKTASYMARLASAGEYTLNASELEQIQKDFCAYASGETKTAESLAHCHQKYGYLIDTHTAVAYGAALAYQKESESGAPILVVSTANPYKFAADVYRSLTNEAAGEDFEALRQLHELTGTPIPQALSSLEGKPVLHKKVIAPESMKEEVLGFL